MVNSYVYEIYIPCIVYVSFGKSCIYLNVVMYILNNILLTIHLFNTLVKKNDFMKMWKPQTSISSIMLIKNFAIESCVIKEANNARLELATPNQTYSSTYAHLHLKSVYFSILRKLIIIFIFMY